MKINLDKERQLSLTLNDMSLYEEKSGKNFLILLNEGINASTLRDILWACLLCDDPKLTHEDVGKLVNSSNMNYVSECLSKILKSSLPEGEGSPNQ